MSTVASVTVDWNDQESMNEFSCLAYKSKTLERKIFKSKEKIQGLEDASDEIMMQMSNDGILVAVVAEVFIEMNEEGASDLLETRLVEERKDLELLVTQKDAIQDKVKILSTQLYKKFGTQINLDES
eukprot:Trichotokara_eunicae@DN1650_c0_g1_i1.p1